MKVLTSVEMQTVDRATSSSVGISSRVLMENAGRSVVNLIIDQFAELLGKTVFVFAGSGNNGGDGLVIARVLANLGVQVEVWLVKDSSQFKNDAAEVFQSWVKSQGKVTLLAADNISVCRDALLSQAGLIVDAIFGTGFSGVASGISAEAINLINSVRSNGIKVIGLDIASGVDATTGNVKGGVVFCDHTVALGALKVGHVCFPGRKYAGAISLAEIGIPRNLPELVAIKRELVTESLASNIIKEKFSVDSELHKGTKGTVVVIGGSNGYYGAPLLAGKSALKSGAGLVKLIVPRSAASAVVSSSNELICFGLTDENGNFAVADLSELSRIITESDAIVIGPGLGIAKGAKQIFEGVLDHAQKSNTPLVIDADALNLIALDPSLLAKITANSVLTPHPGEMGRLLGISSKEVQSSRFQSVENLADKVKAVILLKGASSITYSPSGSSWINSFADQALATAGSGDVLSGIIGSLLSRKFYTQEAAFIGAFIHGKCIEVLGDQGSSLVGTVASDIIIAIPKVIESCLKMREIQYSFHSLVV